MMFEQLKDDIARIKINRGSMRFRPIQSGPDYAYYTGYDLPTPLRILRGDLREDYLDGVVKVVANQVTTKNTSIFLSWSIIAARLDERAEKAVIHRQRMLVELQGAYRNAIVAEICAGPDDHPKRRARMRNRMNKALGTSTPEPALVERYFAHHPEAIEKCAYLKRVWQAVHDYRPASSLK